MLTIQGIHRPILTPLTNNKLSNVLWFYKFPSIVKGNIKTDVVIGLMCVHKTKLQRSTTINSDQPQSTE